MAKAQLCAQASLAKLRESAEQGSAASAAKIQELGKHLAEFKAEERLIAPLKRAMAEQQLTAPLRPLAEERVVAPLKRAYSWLHDTVADGVDRIQKALPAGTSGVRGQGKRHTAVCTERALVVHLPIAVNNKPGDGHNS